MKIFSIVMISFLLIPVSWADSKFEVKAVDQQDQRWYFRNLNVFEKENVVKVNGKMTAMSRFGLPRGHIEIAAVDSVGKKIAEKTVDFSPSILTYRSKQKGGVRFSADFGQDIPQGTTFKVAFRKIIPVEK